MYDDIDFDEEITIELTYTHSEWNHLHSLVARGEREKREEDGWPEDELAEASDLRKDLTLAIGDETPGNGAADWPDSMKEAWDRTVMEDFLEGRERL